MTKTTNLRSALLNAAILTVTQLPAVHAGTLYWDTNGNIPGAGTAGGSWDSGSNWSSDSTGSSPTVAWINGEAAVFSASTDGTAAKTVTIGGTVATPLIFLEELAAVTLSGGSIDITGGSAFNTVVFGTTTGFPLVWNPAVIGTGDLTLAAHGDLSNTGGSSNSFLHLTGASTFTGKVTITSGLLHASSSFGNAANTVLLDGGGLLDPNLNLAFTRNLEIGPSGGTLRNYGSVTSFRLQGTLSGSGAITRTDGGTTILTGDGSGYTGSLNLLRGTTQIGIATSTGNLIPNAAGVTLGDATGAATLRYLADASFTLGTPVALANAGSSLQWQGTGADDVMTLNSAIGSDTAVGNLRINSGTITLATGAAVTVGTVSITATPANSALAVIGTLNIGNGAQINTRYFNIGDGGNTAGRIDQTGGTATVEGGGTGFRIGHWNQGALTPGSVYNLSGGTLDGTLLAANAGTARFMNIGWDGLGTMTVGGGAGPATLKAAGIQIDANGDSPTYNSSLSVATNGRVEIGALGTASASANDRILLDGGSLVATANSTWAATTAANSASTFDVDGFNPSLGGNITGTATITVIDTFGGGSLGLGGGTGNNTIAAPLAGTLPIFKTGTGTVTLSGASPSTSPLTVAAGTLQLTGSFAGNVTAEDSGTLAGEGVIGGNLILGGTLGSTLLIDPATAGRLEVTGTVTLTGSSRVILASPLVTLDPVIDVLKYGSLAGNPAAGLSLGNPLSYRSATFTDDAFNALIRLSIDTKALVWEGTGGLWNVGASSNWSDGAASTFFWGDLVTFNDTASVTNVGLYGELQPGRVLVDSDTNNFVMSNAGVAQVETALALGDVTADGDVIVTITSSDLTGSPLAVPAAVIAGDTANAWATKARAALTANAAVNALFLVGGTDASIVLTRRADTAGRFVANDTTLNIGLSNGTPSPGITPNPTSADTVTGYPTSFISGSADLVKKGSSTLTINAPNTYTGGTVISEGTIDIRQAGALGTGSVTLGDAATGTSNVALYLDSARVNFGRPVIVSNNGTGTATLGSRATVTGTGDNNQFTNILLGRDVVFDSNANDRTDFENITGTGNIRITGAGRSIFPTSPANWVGNVTVATSGALASLQIGVASTAGNRIPDASHLTVEAGGLVRLSATGETIAGLFGEGTINTNSPSGGTGTLTVGFGGANGDFPGLLTGNTASNILAFAKTGAGTQVLGGDNTYSGVTTITGGTLQVGSGGATGDLGTGNVTLSAGTTLTYNRTGAVTQEGLLTSAALGAGTLNINGNATTAVTLAGANATFSGIVNINQGSLVFGATNPTNTAGSAPVMNIAAGATLTNTGASNHAHLGTLNLTGGATVTTGTGTGSYNGENYQLNGNVAVAGGSAAALITRDASRTNANSGLALGILNGAKVFTVADVTASAAPDLVISTELENSDSGAGALTKAGPGTMQLAGAIAHSYTGATTVTEGVLLASGSIAGPLAVSTAGTLAPGASAGPFAAGATSLDGTYACEIDGANSDLLAVTGDLTLGTGSTLALATLGGGATQATYVVATYTGVRNGSFATVTGLPAGYSVVYNDTAKQVEVTSASANGYGDWEIANGIAGAGPNTDSDGDGIVNGIEFVIGGDPSGPGSASNGLLQPVALDATYLTYVFRRTDASAAYDPYVEYGSTLTGWAEATGGEPVATPVLISEDNNFFGGGIDRVTVRIPRALATGPKLFARLRVDIP